MNQSSKHAPIGLFVLAGLAAAVQAGDYPIAGLDPSQRPAGAPEIRTVSKDGAWYEQALTGLPAPHPASLSFLEDQGNWHTPFDRPGMTPPYDLRGWHAPRR